MLAHNLCGVSQFERSDGMGGCGFDFVQDERIPSNLFPISWVRWAIPNTVNVKSSEKIDAAQKNSPH
jgi:hypothetical protein